MLSLSLSSLSAFLIGAVQFSSCFPPCPLYPLPSPIPSQSHLPPGKPVLHAESVTCLHTHFILFRGYLELLPPTPPPPPCYEASRGRQSAASHGGKTWMSGRSWSAVVVVPGDRVPGKLRTLLVGTQDITNCTAPLRAAS